MSKRKRRKLIIIIIVVIHFSDSHINKSRKYKKIKNICSKKPKKIITVKKDARTLKK
jgi:hypothetical protein